MVGALVAAGGTGKSFFILMFLMMSANGGQWGPFASVKKLKILYLSGEDDQGELDQRMWAIGNGIYPEGVLRSICGRENWHIDGTWQKWKPSEVKMVYLAEENDSGACWARSIGPGSDVPILRIK